VLERFVTLPPFPNEDRFRTRNLAFEILSNWGPYLEFNYHRQNPRKPRHEDRDKENSSIQPQDILEINASPTFQTETSDDEEVEITAPTSKDPFEQLYHRPYEITTYITLQKVLSFDFLAEYRHLFRRRDIGSWSTS
jgi:hypothetical protein